MSNRMFNFFQHSVCRRRAAALAPMYGLMYGHRSGGAVVRGKVVEKGQLVGRHENGRGVTEKGQKKALAGRAWNQRGAGGGDW